MHRSSGEEVAGRVGMTDEKKRRLGKHESLVLRFYFVGPGSH